MSFGGTGNESLSSTSLTLDGGLIVAGYTDSHDTDVTDHIGGMDYWIVKLDSSGRPEWKRSFGGTGNDMATSVQQTRDLGYVVAGITESQDGNVSDHIGNRDYWIIKLDGTGKAVWTKSLGGSDYDWASSIQQTRDGGYIVAGGSESSDHDVTDHIGGADYWVVKLDRAGKPEWKRSYGGTLPDVATSIQQTAEGGYIVGGYSFSSDRDVTDHIGDADFWILKLDYLGNPEWKRSYGGTLADIATSIQQTTDGGYIVAGSSESSNHDVTDHIGGIDCWVVKLDRAGNPEWKRSYGGTSGDAAASIQQIFAGGYVIAGTTDSADRDVTNPRGKFDYWIVRLDKNGNLVWQKSYGGTSQELASSVHQTSDGGYVIAGSTNSTDRDVTNPLGNFDYWIVKLYDSSTLFLRIDSIGTRCVGDKYTINASTNLEAGEKVLVKIFNKSALAAPTQVTHIDKPQSGEFSGVSGLITVETRTSPVNRTWFDVDFSAFKPDTYMVIETSISHPVMDMKQFDVIEGSACLPVPVTTPTISSYPVQGGSSWPAPVLAGLALALCGFVLIILIMRRG